MLRNHTNNKMARRFRAYSLITPTSVQITNELSVKPCLPQFRGSYLLRVLTPRSVFFRILRIYDSKINQLCK